MDDPEAPPYFSNHAPTTSSGGQLGNIFQRDLIAYVLTWLYKHIISGKCRVASEVQEVHPFDDIVIWTEERQTTSSPKSNCHMIQAKHSKRPKFINPDNFTKVNDEFDLSKYFRGYLRMRNSTNQKIRKYYKAIQYMTIVTNHKIRIARFPKQEYNISEALKNDSCKFLPTNQQSKWVQITQVPIKLEKYLIERSNEATELAKMIFQRMKNGTKITNKTQLFKKYQVTLLIYVLPVRYSPAGSPLQQRFIDQVYSDSTNKSMFEIEFSRLIENLTIKELRRMKIKVSKKSWYDMSVDLFKSLDEINIDEFIIKFKKSLKNNLENEKITLHSGFNWIPLIGHVFCRHPDKNQVYVFSHNFIYNQKLLENYPLKGNQYLSPGYKKLHYFRRKLADIKRKKLKTMTFCVESDHFLSSRQDVLDLSNKPTANRREVKEFCKKLRLLFQAPTTDEIRIKISKKLPNIPGSSDVYFLESRVSDWTARKTDWITELNVHCMFNKTLDGEANTLDVRSVDTIIVGAGFPGLYTLLKLKKERFSVKLFEASSGTSVGNSFKNCYRSAQVFELCNENLWKDFQWTKRFPGHKEIQKHFQPLDYNLNISKSIKFDTSVTAVRFNDTRNQWHVILGNGVKTWAKNVILCSDIPSIDITNGMGYSLKQKLRHGTSTYPGITVATYPNLFFVNGIPNQSSNPVDAYVKVNYVAGLLVLLRDTNISRLEA